MMTRITHALILFSLLALCPAPLQGQGQFDISLDTLGIPGMPGLHSFTFGTHQGQWLLIGGRQDGMHPKFGGFGTSNSNQHIRVVNPTTAEVWSRPIAELPDTLQEQLRSANMAFVQHGETLLLVGGYGRSEVAQNHITYPYLTLVNVPALMDAVQYGGALQPHIVQVRDTFFAVAGGQMQHLADTFYLVGGHRFDGIYSANSNNPTQRYTDALRKFTLAGNGSAAQVLHKQERVDEFNLHRRDYNLSPHVFQDGERGLMAFSGVFQPGAALAPFLNIVAIRPGNHAPVSGFSQFLANYHCARAPLYSQSANEMHTLFFGGMSEYWIDEQDSLVRDPRLPFVKTISRVTRLADGGYEEVAFDLELPYYTGTGAEFILAEGVPTVGGEIVDYDSLPSGSHLIGYIVGGMVTPSGQRNPFVSNTVSLTSASSGIIRVFLHKDLASSTGEVALPGRYDLDMTVFPNPAADQWHLRLDLPRAGHLRAMLQDATGRFVRHWDWQQQPAHTQQYSLSAADLPPGIYWLTVNLDGVFVETKLVAKH